MEAAPQSIQSTAQTAEFARCIEKSKRVRWDLERDVIRGRGLDTSQKFLPDGLSLVGELEFLSEPEQRFFSQVQGRTYANIFGLVERFINAKILEISGDHWLGDQVALEALVRFSDEELKHQELFRRLELLAAAEMPAGYRDVSEPNAVARAVLSKSTWAVLALTCHIEIFTQVHYRQSIENAPNLSELWQDVFLFHCREECQHAIMDELEWSRLDAKLSDAERDRAVDDLIDLVIAVDGILQAQATADSDYYIAAGTRDFSEHEEARIREVMLKAYRWQYIVSGIRDGRFLGILTGKISKTQTARVTAALAPLM